MSIASIHFCKGWFLTTPTDRLCTKETQFSEDGLHKQPAHREATLRWNDLHFQTLCQISCATSLETQSLQYWAAERKRPDHKRDRFTLSCCYQEPPETPATGTTPTSDSIFLNKLRKQPASFHLCFKHRVQHGGQECILFSQTQNSFCGSHFQKETATHWSFHIVFKH